MALYTISDLHLGFNVEKPMDIFGDKWKGHCDKIKENWLSKITEEDMVLIAGDISWSLREQDSKYDLDWINELPGRKIISKGNHDYWWGSISKLNQMYENTKFVQNNFYTYNDYAICGTRGWICPSSDKYSEKDAKIYSREQIRLKLSLDAAKRNKFERIIVMLHYPPVNDKIEESEFTKIIKEYNVEKVIYGHLHGPVLSGKVLNGYLDGVEYILSSADYLDFNPKRIL
ncbi:metallophosphoesterase [Clostridium sp.]|uniref:metallophosphoesterase n=1 Tax=Clostridium sp. TaxID=1506 RepID=UPI002845937B|nr:metallophosphoesterase [Clostridium sp.]MDR3596056.1 metallophosphoesterase [Clostridium sp.]